jgi:uncharacterized protein YjdB
MAKIRKMRVFLLALVLGLGTVPSCENWMVERLLGQKDEEEAGELVAVTGISLNPNVITITMGDGPINLNLTLYPANAVYKDIRWESSNPNVVSVDNKSGAVMPVDKGNATIMLTVTDRGGHTFSSTCLVTVNLAPPVRGQKQIVMVGGYNV